MKRLTLFSVVLMMGALFLSCSDDSSTGPNPQPELGPDPTQSTEASSENKFVYNAMNEWYLYFEDVPDLADNRFDDEDAKNSFLNGYSGAEALFNDLLFMPENVDIYSFFIDDYQDYRDRQNGITAALGLEYGFIGFQNTNDIVGYVQYVVEGSPADRAGLERLDLFTEVDGVPLNRSNFQTALGTTDAHELTMATISEANGGVSFTETGEVIQVEQERVIEDPIFKTAVIDTNNTRIGYIVYNAFQGNSNENLNAAFGNFQSQGIDELVLDLRYNGGGSVLTSQLLASLISGNGSDEVFAELTYNSKKTTQSRTEFFLDEVPVQNESGNYNLNSGIPVNGLNLNRLYVLTTGATASASETTINSLLPYNIDITIIGEQTEGKDVGSLTFVDSPSTSYLVPNDVAEQAEFEIAIQPIVVSLLNAQDQDYPDGFTPDFEINERSVENFNAKPALGDVDEPLLEQAISAILGNGNTQATIRAKDFGMMQNSVMLKDLKQLQPANNGQYIEPFMMPKQ